MTVGRGLDRPASGGVGVAGQPVTAGMIAGLAGSAFHGSMLGRDGQARILIVTRRPNVEVMDEMIAAATRLDERIVRLDLAAMGDGRARDGTCLTGPADGAGVPHAAAALPQGLAA